MRFEVSAWLEIDAWLCKITIRISFALTLQVDIVAELALQGDLSAGARVRAAIAVSIFGRTIGLSIGLGFNAGLVDNAAARVGRFMNMGLVQEVPCDPVARTRLRGAVEQPLHAQLDDVLLPELLQPDLAGDPGVGTRVVVGRRARGAEHP